MQSSSRPAITVASIRNCDSIAYIEPRSTSRLRHLKTSRTSRMSRKSRHVRHVRHVCHVLCFQLLLKCNKI